MNKLDLNKVISNRIIYLSKQKNISIRELARRSKIRQSTINGILNDGRIPTIATLIDISRGLGISVLELLDTPEINKNQPATMK